MGFYGNAVNIAKSQFTFDKIYPNRKEMDTNCEKDGIYVGRRVLVEYDVNEYVLSQFYTLRDDNGDLVFSLEKNLEDKNILVVGSATGGNKIKTGDVISVPASHSCNPEARFTEYWKCKETVTRTINGETKQCAGFEWLEDAAYVINYNIDIAEYGPSRGFDSTVWEKVMSDGKAKYVAIADLNSVVPTFDLAADAPTQVPLTPHFDARESSNLYYKLHWQPAWGLRIKSSNNNITDGGNKVSTETAALKSDEVTRWTKAVYDKATGKEEVKYANLNGNTLTWQSSGNDIPAAIYYNKDGFNSDVRHFDSDTANKISIMPTGQSCNKYKNHDGTEGIAPDIQELSIQLPALGNAVSDLWDIVYDTTRNKDISWVEPNQTSTGTRNLETFAGCINSMHDLMGMIIFNSAQSSYQDGYIYKIDGKYYRKGYSYQYNPIASSYYGYEKVILNADSYMDGIYYIDTQGTKATSWSASATYYKRVVAQIPVGADEFYVSTADDSGYFKVGQVWDLSAAVPHGLQVGIRSKKDDLVELRQFENELTTIYGLILDLNKFLDESTETIEATKELLDKFENNIVPGELMMVDDLGHVSSANLRTDENLLVDISSGCRSPYISITHKPNRSTTADTVKSTLAFGGTFTTTQYDFDNSGHILKIAPTQFTLPATSLTNGTTGTVVTGIDHNQGSFTVNKTNLGNVTLGEIQVPDYEKTIDKDYALGAAISELIARDHANAEKIKTLEETTIPALEDRIKALEETIEKLKYAEDNEF